MTTNATIRAAIESRLATWAAAQTPALTVAWQNKAFTKPTGAHLRATMLPAPGISNHLQGGDHLRVGLYQIDVCVPQGAGPGAAEAFIAALEAQFHAGLRLTAGSGAVLITEPLSALPAQNEDTHYVVPCRFEYRLHET